MMGMINPALQNIKLFEVRSVELPATLLAMDEKQKSPNFKFGVLYSKPGQSEDEMYCNAEGSSYFDEFLQFLGEKIILKGFSGFKGGLDTKSVLTGTYTVHTKWKDIEIMFHVSTYLPFKLSDKQQIDRNKHIGNDVGVIIFKDGDVPFSPRTFTSDFNHIYAIVQVDKKRTAQTGKTHYKIGIASKEGVPSFEPLIPYPASFEKNEEFRSFLFSKLINGECMAYNAPTFAAKLNRTRLQILRDLQESYSNQQTNSNSFWDWLKTG